MTYYIIYYKQKTKKSFFASQKPSKDPEAPEDFTNRVAFRFDSDRALFRFPINRVLFRVVSDRFFFRVRSNRFFPWVISALFPTWKRHKIF